MSRADAEKLMKDGTKAENNKIMMIKSSPEWDKAADCYSKAATIFRSPNVKAFPEAINAFEKAANAHKMNGSAYNAGTMYETAGNTLRDNGGLDKCAAYYAKAAQHFRDGGNPEKAAETCIKAGKAMTDKDSDAAIKLFIEAIDIYEGEDKHIYIADTWRGCLALMLRNGKTDSGIALLERMQRNFLKLEQMEYLRKAQLCVVILKLSKGDAVAATQARDEYEETEFSFSKEGDAASSLIEAFDDGDVEKVQELVKTQVFTLLENSVARIAAKLPDVCQQVGGDMTGASKGGGRGGGAETAAGGDEEEDDDLC